MNKECIMFMPSLASRLKELREVADHVHMSIDELCEGIILEWLEEDEQDEQSK